DTGAASLQEPTVIVTGPPAAESSARLEAANVNVRRLPVRRVTALDVNVVEPCVIVTRLAATVPAVLPSTGISSTPTARVASSAGPKVAPTGATTCDRAVSIRNDAGAVAAAVLPALSLHEPTTTSARPGTNAARLPNEYVTALPLRLWTAPATVVAP